MVPEKKYIYDLLGAKISRIMRASIDGIENAPINANALNVHKQYAE